MEITLEWITSNFDIVSVGHGRFWCDYLVKKEKTATYRRPPGKRGPAKCPDIVAHDSAGLMYLTECKGTTTSSDYTTDQFKKSAFEALLLVIPPLVSHGIRRRSCQPRQAVIEKLSPEAKGSRVGILGGTALLLTPGQHCEHIQEEYGQDSTNDTNSGFCIHLLSPPYLLKMHARGPSLALIFKRLTCFSYYSRGLEYSRPQTDRARHRELESRRECNNRNRLIFNSG